jgi:ABC-type dipeptide/oligopeptide/nickel transport system ATPase component
LRRALEVSDLVIEFAQAGRVRLTVSEASFGVDEEEILGIVGVSGAGKSILARALTGYISPPGRVARGSVKVFGQDLITASQEQLRKIRGNSVSIIVQNARAHLNPVLKMGNQIGNVYKAHHRTESGESVKRRVVQMLNDVGIPAAEDRYNAYPHELSGGMAQRCMIAMALICSPRLLIADEPTSGLDVTIQDQILKLFRRSVKEQGAAGVLISRDMGIIANFCDRVAVLEQGRIVESETVGAFFKTAQHPMSKALVAAASYGTVPRARGKTERSQA